MNTPAKLGAYTLGLVAVFGAAAGLGSVVGPVDAVAADTASHNTAPHGETPADSPMDGSAQASAAGTHLPGGLQVSENGYSFDAAGSLPAAHLLYERPPAGSTGARKIVSGVPA